jgi:hypothetical protein
MNSFKKAAAEAIRSFHPLVSFEYLKGVDSCELGGQIPWYLVEMLRQIGAEVLEYRHRGTIATVVRF